MVTQTLSNSRNIFRHTTPVAGEVDKLPLFCQLLHQLKCPTYLILIQIRKGIVQDGDGLFLWPFLWWKMNQHYN